jgi:phosphate transport system substrate-binding protein
MLRAKRALVVVAFSLVSCTGSGLPATPPTQVIPTTLRLLATTPTLPMAQNVTSAYSRLNPSIRFDIRSGNYEAMLDAVTQGEAPYFVTNHFPLDSQTESLWAAPLGQDGIAVIVHPDTSVQGLTTGQLRDIFQGWTTNWAAVGGEDAPITVISREDGSGTRAEFESLIMGNRQTTSSAQVAPSSSAVVQSVARTPGSIGYVSMSYVNASVRTLSVDGVLPTHDTVARSIYPLRSIVYIVGQAEPQGDMRAFIAWMQSVDGQTVISRTHAALIPTPSS